MQSDICKWEAPVQQKTCITGELGEGDLFRELTLFALSHNLNRSSKYGFYPIVNFSDLITSSARSMEAYRKSAESKFFKIGTWSSPKGDWMISLAVPLPTKHPFSPDPNPVPSLKLVISYVFPENLDNIEVNIDNIFFSIGQTGEAGQHTLQPIPTAFQTDCFKFTRETNVQVHTIPDFEAYLNRSIDPSSTYKFNLDMLCSVHTQKVIVPNYTIPGAFFDFTIIDSVCQYLSLQDISNLRVTNRNFSRALINCSSRRLRSLISRWFSKIPEFVTALRISGGVLSGSSILSVLCPGNWEPNDLDLIVLSSSQHTLTSFLAGEGYTRTVISPSFDDIYPTMSGFELKRFTKRNLDGELLSIDVSVLNGSFPFNKGPAEFIRTYHSTVVMNFYDGYTLYCLYPSLTFGSKFYVNLHSHLASSASTEVAISKYVSRGYRRLLLPSAPLLPLHYRHPLLPLHPLLPTPKLPPPVNIWCDKVVDFQQ